MTAWNDKLQDLGIDKAKGWKAVRNKLAVALDKAISVDIQERLSIHRSQLGLHLGILAG